MSAWADSCTCAAGERQSMHSDAGCPGLRLVVYPSGRKSWLLRTDNYGRVIGSYPAMSHATAVATALQLQAENRAAGVAYVYVLSHPLCGTKVGVTTEPAKRLGRAQSQVRRWSTLLCQPHVPYTRHHLEQVASTTHARLLERRVAQQLADCHRGYEHYTCSAAVAVDAVKQQALNLWGVAALGT